MNSVRIMLSQKDQILFINLEEILFCQSDNYYTYINLTNGKKILHTKSLTKFQLELSLEFLRVSQTYVINKKYIKAIKRKNKKLVLEGEYEIPFTLPIKTLIESLSHK